MTKQAHERGNGMCRLCLRDLYRFGHGDTPFCDACLLLRRRNPDADPATVPNGRTERLPQEQPSIDPRWADDGAACRGAPVELFEHRTLCNYTTAAEVLRQAAEVFCARCPIMQRCRAEADAHEFLGLWGGQWRSYNNHHRYTARDLIRERKAVA